MSRKSKESMDEEDDMNLNSDNDANNKRNPNQDSSSDSSPEKHSPPKKKRIRNRSSKAELLIREMRESAERREKAKVERETMLQKRHDDQMALENRRLDAMMLLISKVLPDKSVVEDNENNKEMKGKARNVTKKKTTEKAQETGIFFIV